MEHKVCCRQPFSLFFRGKKTSFLFLPFQGILLSVHFGVDIQGIKNQVEHELVVKRFLFVERMEMKSSINVKRRSCAEKRKKKNV